MGDDWYNYIYDPGTDWTPATWTGGLEGTQGDSAIDYTQPTNSQTPGAFGGTGGFSLQNLINSLTKAGSSALSSAATPQGLATLASALMGYQTRAQPSGGGVGVGYSGPRPMVREIVQGRYGPVAVYREGAAPASLPTAPPVAPPADGYMQGGHVKMEDGGFVMTKRAVDGAGGPRGLAALVPQARMIRGPGTGTSDSIPASIQGRSGVTPAKVSNGEAYVPRRAVQQAGGPQAMYALMNKLQRRA